MGERCPSPTFCEIDTRLSDLYLYENYLKYNITKDEFELLQKMLLMQNKCPTIQNLKTNIQIIAHRKQTVCKSANQRDNQCHKSINKIYTAQQNKHVGQM